MDFRMSKESKLMEFNSREWVLQHISYMEHTSANQPNLSQNDTLLELLYLVMQMDVYTSQFPGFGRYIALE